MDNVAQNKIKREGEKVFSCSTAAYLRNRGKKHKRIVSYEA